MAHEIAHVAARHGTRQASRGQLVNLASLPLIFLGGWAGYAVRQGAGLAVPMAFLKFSRGFEQEADLLGLQYLYKSGYDPTAFVDFFERMEAMEKRKPGTVSQLFRSHPKMATRIKFTQKNVQELLAAQPQYVVSTSEFQEVTQQLARHGEREKGHSRENGSHPSEVSRQWPDQGDDGDNTKPDQDERPTLKRRNP